MSPAKKISGRWLDAPETQAVFSALERGGFQARAVGGIVRNTLLGLPATDIDIATDAPPTAILKLARESGLKTIPTGISHGTITVVVNATPFQVTTLRRDIKTDGRHADVAFTTDWTADADRRDFTINALYCDRHGTIFDPLGGAADLSPVRVRFIGDPRQRVTEDYLRIMRFFRFSATFCENGRLDEQALAAVSHLKSGLTHISGERIQSELFKLLAAPYAIPVTVALVNSGVFGAIFEAKPNLAALARLQAIEASLQRLPDPVLRLAALATDRASDADDVDRRLKLSARNRKTLSAAAHYGETVSAQTSVSDAKIAIYKLGTQAFVNSVLLSWARTTVPIDDAAFHALVSLPERWLQPRFPIGGADAVKAGAAEGQAIGHVLAQVEAAWIGGGFSANRNELLIQLQQRIAETKSRADDAQ